MTNPKPAVEATQVKIVCVNCKAVNPMDKMIDVRDCPALGPGVREQGLLCPDCGHWTHSYYLTNELEERRERLDTLHRLYTVNATPGRWTTYEGARNSYQKEFERVQQIFARKVKV